MTLPRKFISSIVAVVTIMSATVARGADPAAPIVTSIEADTANAVVMPEGLMQRLQPGAEPEEPDDAVQRQPRTHAAGYRVQVFSDNNARTAKNEARKRGATVASRFPQYRTYRKYSAPYWRLRVGDFRTQSQAESAAAELRRAFPAFSKEIRVVRDRINLND